MSHSVLYTSPLVEADPELDAALQEEQERQQRRIDLVASANLMSMAVRRAQASPIGNRVADGYPSRRLASGAAGADVVEKLAVDRARRLFGARHANVQPHSGAQANLAVMFALLRPGDTVLGMASSAGGHATHGARRVLSGRWFNPVRYGVREEDGRIDYARIETLAHETRPRLIIAGFSTYPRHVDWARFRAIADGVGALLLADMAAIAGLVAGGAVPSPVPHAHVTTSATHKTLRGPRGGLILTDIPSVARRIDASVFPGVQGAPFMNMIAAKAVAFQEARQPAFQAYARQVIANARLLAEVLVAGGLDLKTGGTDNHLLLVDLRALGLTGLQAEDALERAGITASRCAIPSDDAKPSVISGLRLGTAAATTRGLGIPETEEVGELIVAVFETLARDPAGDATVLAGVRERVEALAARFPCPA